MKVQIKEFAALTGVSVRTLHYYDEIGLLQPAYVDRSTGYRFYDETSLLRMQQILFYRELDFSLSSIAQILSSPDFDREKALYQQKQLLILKKERLERLIAAIDSAAKGENVMGAFDNKEFEQYKAEAKQRWGSTEAYREYESREQSPAEQQTAADGLNAIFGEFGRCMKAGEAPQSAAAQALVQKLQQHITDNFYTCTPQILAGLGQMYVVDERFRANIDRHGVGTAEFVSTAIGHFSKS